MPKNDKIQILAIESSADETSAAVLFGDKKKKRFRLASNIIYSQIKIHQKTGGIVPEVAARAHLPKILPVIRQALAEARVKLQQITAIAVTAGPGLVTSLRIGVDTAKALAFARGIPIIPVNHMEGHLLSALGHPHSFSPLVRGRLRGGLFPAVGLTVSGGHTMLVLIKNFGQYKILGETLDDAAGECFDKVAKILGLPYPGGPQISKLAKSGKPLIDFPRPLINSKDYNFSFSGLKTAVLYYVKNNFPSTPSLKVRGGRGELLKADIATSMEQAIIDVLVAKTIRAAKEYKVKTVLLGGGVSANKKLRQELTKSIKKFLPTSNLQLPISNLTTDNAGMIAIAAFYHAIYNDTTTYNKVKADPNWELKSWR